MIIQPVLCSFHQLFRNDPQGLTLQKVSFSTSHLVMTLPAPFCKQYQHASHFHQSFRNQRKTRHPKAADLHQKFRIPDFSLKELQNVRKIASYSYPPTDMKQNQQEWHKRYIEDLVCNVMCPYSERCDHISVCLCPDGWRDRAVQMLKDYDNQLAEQEKEA